tara:strand:+ start:353 stop:562 length:210 start_codon:yes stop_codon:yes gene_type:complete
MGCSTDLYWEQRIEKTSRAQRRERNIRENMLKRLERAKEQGKQYSHFSVVQSWKDPTPPATSGGYYVGQ